MIGHGLRFRAWRGAFDPIAFGVRIQFQLQQILAQQTHDESCGCYRDEKQQAETLAILVEKLGVSEDQVVSSDIIEDPRAAIIDLEMTQVVDGDLVKVMSWYDNEWGYAAQMVREAVRVTS